MALQVTMQRRACQVRDRCLQSVQAIVQRQQRVSAEGDEDRLLLDRENGRARFLRTGLAILRSLALPPPGHGLRVDPVAPGQRPQPLVLLDGMPLSCGRSRGEPGP